MTTWMWIVVGVGALGWGAGIGLDLLMRIEDALDRRDRERIMQQRGSRDALKCGDDTLGAVPADERGEGS